jgi:hypothetical protein
MSPTSKRDAIKRKHKAIDNALIRCQEWTLELYNMFLIPHPDYAEGYNNILVMLEQTRAFVKSMKKHV